VTPAQALAQFQSIVLRATQLQADINALGNTLATAGVVPRVFAQPALARILAVVARDHGTTVEMLRGSRLDQPLVEARQMAAWLMVHATTATTPQMGRAMNRDRTTVQWCAKRHQARMDADRDVHTRTTELLMELSERNAA